MVRIFADEDFPLPAVEELRRLGHDVLTVYESGHANQRWPDDQVFACAQKEARVLLTQNRGHFKRLHHQSKPNHFGTTSGHFGIVVCTRDSDFVALARRIDATLAEQPEVRGQLIRIYRPAQCGEPSEKKT